MANSMNHGDGGKFEGRGEDLRPGDDLLWTAYQYTADELPEPAARAFEAALETDQRAREALSEAVALGDTIRAALGPEGVTAPAVMPAALVASSVGAGSVGTATRSSNRNTSYGWAAACVAFGAAACLALMMALRSTPPADAPIAERPAAKTEGQADQQLLAVLWPEVSTDLTTVDSGSGLIVGIDETDTSAAAELTADDDVIIQPMPEATAPDWLLAAVAEGGE
jgi:hypothetical protein